MAIKQVRGKEIILHNTCLHPLLIILVLHLIQGLYLLHHIQSGIHMQLHLLLVYRYNKNDG